MTRLPGSRRQLAPPKAVVDVARFTMGGIDLDPFSTSEVNRLVQAARFLDRTGGSPFTSDWVPGGSGRLFLAVHTGIDLSRRLALTAHHGYRSGHIKEAVLWFGCNEIITHCPWLWDFPVCLPFRRLAPCFWDDELERFTRVQPADWSAIVYLPVASPSERFHDSVARFHAAASPVGRIVFDQWSGEGRWEEPWRLSRKQLPEKEPSTEVTSFWQREDP